MLFQLYRVLGKRVGRQPEDNAAKLEEAAAAQKPVLAPVEDPAMQAPGMAQLREADPKFDVSHFLQGARGAYETIVRAYATGDLETLRGLVAPDALRGFEQGVAAREAEGRTEAVEFQHQPRVDIEKAEVAAGLARIQVRYLAEFISRTKGPEGEAVDERRTAELWTFQRPVDSADPNWTLTRVEAASA